MKSWRICLSLFLIFVITLFPACADSNSGNQNKTVDFSSNASEILINSKSPDVLSFNIALFSNKKISDVQYIGLEGININNADFNVEIIDNGTDALDGYKYKGLYTKCIMLEITKTGSTKSCEFNNIVLNVDGERRNISFSTPVKHQFIEGNIFTEVLQISVVPNEFASSYINNGEQGAIYKFNATEDLTIESIFFDDFLEPLDVTYSINNAKSQNATFPIAVKKGQQIKIGFSFSSTKATTNSYISTNLFFEYKTTNNSTNLHNSAVVVFDPIYPLKDKDFTNIDKLIDAVIPQ